ncbi:MAG: type II toxin-antitoxin system RelE/ParE family toxin [Pseudolabrys sp.]
MNVVFRAAAYGDLDRIYAWIAKDRPQSAPAVVEKILDSAERLGRYLHLGHTGRRTGTFEWVVTGLPYVIVYRINTEDELIDVVAVFHGAQNRDNE